MKEMDLELPESATSTVQRAAAIRTGNLVFVGGRADRTPDGSLFHPGKLGRDVSIEQGQETGQRTVLNCLADLKSEIGDLDKVAHIVKLLCMVNAASGLGGESQVDKGEGPNNTCIEMIVEVGD